MALMTCSECGGPVSDKASACPKCGAPVLVAGASTLMASVPEVPGDDTSGAAKRRHVGETLGVVALALPGAAAVLSFFWIGNMSLLQGPESTLLGIAAATIAGTAMLVSVEAGQLGFGGAKRDSGPVAWFFFMLFFWIVALPAYLYRRSKYGLNNLAVGGVLVVILFLGTFALMENAIIKRQEELRSRLAAIAAPSTPPAAPEVPSIDSQLELMKSRWVTDDDGLTYIVGRIRNNSGGSVSFVHVEFPVFNRFHEQVGVAQDTISNLAPGATWKFRALVPDATARSAGAGLVHGM